MRIGAEHLCVPPVAKPPSNHVELTREGELA